MQHISTASRFAAGSAAMSEHAMTTLQIIRVALMSLKCNLRGNSLHLRNSHASYVASMITVRYYVQLRSGMIAAVSSLLLLERFSYICTSGARNIIQKKLSDQLEVFSKCWALASPRGSNVVVS